MPAHRGVRDPDGPGRADVAEPHADNCRSDQLGGADAYATPDDLSDDHFHGGVLDAGDIGPCSADRPVHLAADTIAAAHPHAR